MRTPVRVRILLISIFVVITALTLLPIYWMLNVSFLPEAAVLQSRPVYAPQAALFTLEAYADIFQEYRIDRYFFNSISISTVATFISMSLSLSVAYSLAKFEFPGKKALFYFIIWSLTLPWVVYVLPIFRIVSPLGLLDTRGLLVMLYGFSGVPMFSWFALPYMLEFPKEMLEAARIDGAGEIRIVWQIVVPPIRNVLVSLFLLRFIFSYNDLLFSLSFTFDRAKMIMPALLELPGLYETPFAKMTAGGIVSLVPIVILVVVFQRYILSGLTGRSLK
ncbi:MAG: carbohydrate ABC transporter permease [Spirochaetaceae bacterium]